MKSLFKPAIWVMSQMRYTYKFLVLGLLAVATVGFLFYNLYGALNQTVDAASFKRNGSAAVETISHLVQNLQQHRGLSAGVLNGNDAMRTGLAAKDQEIGRAHV